MESIPKLVFFKCVNLKSVDMPDNIRHIGHSAFNGCEHLKELFLPKGICEIEGNPFAKCPRLKKIYISPNSFATPFNGLSGTTLIDLNSDIFIKY